MKACIDTTSTYPPQARIEPWKANEPMPRNTATAPYSHAARRSRAIRPDPVRRPASASTRNPMATNPELDQALAGWAATPGPIASQ